MQLTASKPAVYAFAAAVVRLCCDPCTLRSRQLILCLVRPMRTLHAAIALAAFVVGTASAAAYCDSFPPIAQELQSSSVVLVGRVSAVRDVIAPDGDPRGTFYTVTLIEPMKGRPSATVLLYSENSSGRFPMQVGSEYLIFAHPQRFEGIDRPQLAINNCGHSAALPDGSEALATVRRLTKA